MSNLQDREYYVFFSQNPSKFCGKSWGYDAKIRWFSAVRLSVSCVNI